MVSHVEALEAQIVPVRFRAPDCEPLAIQLLGAEARYSLRIRPGDAVGISDLAVDLLDQPINTVATDRGRTVARVGPDEWIILGPIEKRACIARDVEGSLGNLFFSLTDISERNRGILVSGHGARLVLSGACALDLSESGFPVGAATRTLFGKSEIVLIHNDHCPGYRIEFWRSYTDYVAGLLRVLARGDGL